jgi:hypothetical protein
MVAPSQPKKLINCYIPCKRVQKYRAQSTALIVTILLICRQCSYSFIRKKENPTCASRLKGTKGSTSGTQRVSLWRQQKSWFCTYTIYKNIISSDSTLIAPLIMAHLITNQGPYQIMVSYELPRTYIHPLL